MSDDWDDQDEWYAHQFVDAVERQEPWAVYYAEQLEKQMRYWLNRPFYTPLEGWPDE